MKRLRLTIAVVLACTGVFTPAAAQNAPRSPGALMDALMWGKEPVGGPFNLIDQDGRRRSNVDFLGEPLILYFGYTHCPDVCPTDVLEISTALKHLDQQQVKAQPVFVTLDPERDTSGLLKDYLESFDPRWVGLTGDLEDIRRLALQYKVWFAKIDDGEKDSYTIDHMSFIFLVGSDGKYVNFLPPGTPSERIAKAVRENLR